ncbi:CheR methyltransferase, SAM binding domain protein [Sphingomonas sp. EC-HK361]|uniref:CheR family methyltransferase n=1 Tax=Sphingomonas sp. EC-HK361 TaxID=2038397 RepID=UPI00125BFF56|nr:protein-glutamate O-methyltransferase CheR [Sphingomonas sp. EC-HK361]VVT10818.1 CheR methyltransferase, SAM binding domain protein [Sphingomonas sp. EC-HK361]
MIQMPMPHPGPAGIIAALMQARAGQEIAANRAWRIDLALKPLLAERGLKTLDELVGQLLDGKDTTVGDRIVDALLNQESSFFRDAGIIEATAQAIRETSADGLSARPKIWCAGCARGQEPLSLAMIFAEESEGALLPDILATDISDAALQRARQGRYTQFEIQRGLPIRRMMRWFDAEAVSGDWIAKPELLRMVRYRRQNLVADAAPVGLFDAVMCRNVLFYLTPPLRAAVLDRFANALRPGGLLVLGAGETVIGLSDRFTPSQRFRGFYEALPAKRSRPVASAA